MSGHNKWSKIKNKKAVTDAQKSKIFGKLVRFITVESKKAKGDVNAPGLRAAIEKARGANVPSDNIERAIKKRWRSRGRRNGANNIRSLWPGRLRSNN
jgi:transcriptional/translational regulatory protein YebC/TACO1